MNTEALLKVAEVLDRVVEERKKAVEALVGFDMGHWASSDWAVAHDGYPFEPGSRERREYCGTTACACGHAALDPWFIAQGFRLSSWMPKTHERRPVESLDQFIECAKAKASFDITYKGQSHFEAVRAFFDIPYNQAEYLFGGNCREPEEVAKEIRDFVADPEGVCPADKSDGEDDE